MNITEFPKLQIKQDSTITFYIHIEYMYFTLSFQENLLSMTPLGDQQGHNDLLMISLSFLTGDVFMLDFISDLSLYFFLLFL